MKYSQRQIDKKHRMKAKKAKTKIAAARTTEPKSK
jgi:hypothetical protein